MQKFARIKAKIRRVIKPHFQRVRRFEEHFDASVRLIEQLPDERLFQIGGKYPIFGEGSEIFRLMFAKSFDLEVALAVLRIKPLTQVDGRAATRFLIKNQELVREAGLEIIVRKGILRFGLKNVTVYDPEIVAETLTKVLRRKVEREEVRSILDKIEEGPMPNEVMGYPDPTGGEFRLDVSNSGLVRSVRFSYSSNEMVCVIHDPHRLDEGYLEAWGVGAAVIAEMRGMPEGVISRARISRRSDEEVIKQVEIRRFQGFWD